MPTSAAGLVKQDARQSMTKFPERRRLVEAEGQGHRIRWVWTGREAFGTSGGMGMYENDA